MPELPEVETVRRGLAPFMAGATITSVVARRPDLRFPLPAAFAQRLAGATVGPLGRRGKYLTAPLSTGETLIMHLGMSGRFTVSGAAAGQRPGSFYYAGSTNPAHDHVAIEVSGPAGVARIDYNDPRRFGFMDLAPTEALHRSKHFDGMGPEPLSEAFTAALFHEALKGRAAPLKAALLDQSVVAGLGNIYVCEALWRARLSPRRAAGRVSGPAAARLHEAVRAVLSEAIEAGGSSLRDFAASDGALGYFQHRFSVYDRAGAPCLCCGAPVRRFVQSGRSTFACGKCQK
ncbi:MAG: bifunctional DNA-formamidopyrimidine glycosylase/DNA-(apurinic or apyrimidinic site) lyase [Parvularculaceae bacterium]|nr:bifunctional DNA-formamidopyrimidine glycosylase/DNA-(apurinic or apyrimidinic site) lyase [Parvularculaceae bacterium]